MLPRKKWYTWTVPLSLVFINREYSSEFYWQCTILVKLQEKCRSSRPEEFCKKGALENFANHRCFPVNFVNLFSKNCSTGCFWKDKSRSSRPEAFCKKGALRNFAKLTRKHLRQSLFYSLRPACNFIKTGSPWQVLSCEFCEHFSKNTFILQNTSGGCFCKSKSKTSPSWFSLWTF